MIEIPIEIIAHFLFVKYFKVARVDFLSLNILLSQVNIYNFGVLLIYIVLDFFL